MARIFITGSSDGLGARAANALSKKGHSVYIHARNPQRAKDAKALCPEAEDCLVADLSSIEETKGLASELNKLGPFDAIIHNAGLMRDRSKGKEGLSSLLAVNVLAPYILTCLVDRPKRLVYLSSGMHHGGDPSLRSIPDNTSYSDSKLYNIMLAKGFARYFPNVACNSLDPGWVQTKMGGASASDDMGAAVDTYVGLAEGTGWAKGQTGGHWYQCHETRAEATASDEKIQEKLFQELERLSGGIKIPSD